MEIANLQARIRRFRDERDWKQFHNHKDMALGICVESAELLEHFQWLKGDEIDQRASEKRQEITEEIADILIYLLELADNLDVDLVKAVEQKLAKNAAKYPVAKAKGSHKKYTELK